MPFPKIEIDHIFVFLDPEENQDPEEARLLKQAGFVESYRRDHPGQGTTNICYCFDNAYLELLWVKDEAAARSEVISKTRLAERALWKANGNSPFGIALRPELPIQTWAYCPPYLPQGISIPVACSSMDAKQPFIFNSIGGKRPDSWSNNKDLKRQNSAGFSEIKSVELTIPETNPPSEDLVTLEQSGVLNLTTNAAHHSMSLSLTSPDGKITHFLQLPSFEIIPAD
ncbi:VOC family protein [Kiloniella sp.]|uniref:VOC family protein n=1 Tax=Kiloniella sp. TaxID=1938587 RepID=UPI003B027A81